MVKQFESFEDALQRIISNNSFWKRMRAGLLDKPSIIRNNFSLVRTSSKLEHLVNKQMDL